MLVDDYLRGDPASWTGVIAELCHVGTTFATLATLVNEIGTLIDANAGTINRRPMASAPVRPNAPGHERLTEENR